MSQLAQSDLFLSAPFDPLEYPTHIRQQQRGAVCSVCVCMCVCNPPLNPPWGQSMGIGQGWPWGVFEQQALLPGTERGVAAPTGTPWPRGVTAILIHATLL